MRQLPHNSLSCELGFGTAVYEVWCGGGPGGKTPEGIGYEATWHDPWEPFYIAQTDLVPRHDERFQNYGFNRISQVCEMHIAGFTFEVLYGWFLVHDGFKWPGAFHQGKEEEQQINRLLFRRFKEELNLRYATERRSHDPYIHRAQCTVAMKRRGF